MVHSLGKAEMTQTAVTGSAERWGPLWGARPADWALSEDQQVPTYEDALARVEFEPGRLVLDVGCGVGAFLRLVAERGGRPYGIDASEALLDVARSRLPDADLRHGDMEALPYDDDTFDLVTGFTSFFFADDMVGALREAGRVARPGAPVVIEVFGAPERCELEQVKGAIAPFRPRGEDGEEVRYWRPGMVEELAAAAVLDVVEAFTCETAYAYRDEEHFLAAMLAAGGAGAVAGPDREPELRAALVAALAGSRRPDGSYRIRNEWEGG